MTSEAPNKFDSSDRRRPRHLADAKSEEIAFPLAWLIIGGLAALIVIGLLGLGVVNIFRQQSITPTPQVSPPLVESVDVPAVEEPADTVAITVIPPTVENAQDNQTVEETTPVEEDVSETLLPETPSEITINSFVKVIGTGGAGASLRAGPGTNNARLLVANEDDETFLLVLEGPRDDANTEDYIWWFVRHPDGTEGWVVEDFITPANTP